MVSRVCLIVAVICISLFGAVTLAASVYVVPRFERIWAESGTEVPAATQLAAAFYGAVRQAVVPFAAGVAAFVLLLVIKERWTPVGLSAFINFLFAAAGVALVVVFVIGLPVLLYMPVFKVGDIVVGAPPP